MDTNNRIPSDLRTARYTKRARACHTTWGPFSSVQLVVEHVVKHDAEHFAKFVARAGRDSDYDRPVDEIIAHAKKNLYQTIYQRCVAGSRGNYGDFRFV